MPVDRSELPTGNGRAIVASTPEKCNIQDSGVPGVATGAAATKQRFFQMEARQFGLQSWMETVRGSRRVSQLRRTEMEYASPAAQRIATAANAAT